MRNKRHTYTDAYPSQSFTVHHRRGATPRHARRHGISLIEMLISLAIAAALLTATMVAIDASFQAYASATAQAATQSSARMVSNRMLTLLRTSTAHGPLLVSDDDDWPVTLDGKRLNSEFIELVDQQDEIIRIEYRDDEQQLWYIRDPGTDDEVEQPLLDGVTAAVFFSDRRQNSFGVWVLERASMDLTILPGAASALGLENDAPEIPIRIIASTMPRRFDD